MSTTATAGQTSGSPSSTTAVQGRGAGNPRRADASSPENADLFSSLLGLLADTRSELPEGAAAPGVAAAEEETPDGAAALASVIDWVQAPVGTLATTEAGMPDEPSPASTESEAWPPGISRQPADPAGSLADAARQTDRPEKSLAPLPEDTTSTATTPSHQEELPPAAVMGQGATTRAKGPGSAQRGAERPTTLMLQGTDTVNWRSAAASRQEAWPATPAASAMAWSTARSTVALHHRFGLSLGIDSGVTLGAESPAGTGLAIAGGTASAHAGDTAMGQRQGGGATDGGALAAASETPSPDEISDPFAATVGTETEETQQQDLRAWTAGSLRQASLRVGEDGEDAINIELSLRGQEVNVEFRTDNAEARSSLQAHAGQTLSDMLQRSGMQLAGLSVGGQALSQRQQPGGDRSPAPSPLPNRLRPAASAAEAAPALHRPAPNSGPSSIDLFV